MATREHWKASQPPRMRGQDARRRRGAARTAVAALGLGAAVSIGPWHSGPYAAEPANLPAVTSGWRAWDHASDDFSTYPFNVEGEVRLPSAGYRVRLAKAAGLRARGNVLVLNLVIDGAPTGAAKSPTVYRAMYLDPKPPVLYRRVLIRYRGRTIAEVRDIGRLP